MGFGLSTFGSPDNSSNKSESISRYLGGNYGEFGSDSSLGIDFSSLLNSHLNTPVNSKLDALLQRLDNNQPLVNMSPEEASEEIFSAIKHINSGIYEVFNKKNKG